MQILSNCKRKDLLIAARHRELVPMCFREHFNATRNCSRNTDAGISNAQSPIFIRSRSDWSLLRVTSRLSHLALVSQKLLSTKMIRNKNHYNNRVVIHKNQLLSIFFYSYNKETNLIKVDSALSEKIFNQDNVKRECAKNKKYIRANYSKLITFHIKKYSVKLSCSC